MKEIRRVLIWSGWLRVSHWSIALSTLVLLVTGWLIEHSPMRELIALEYHYIAASVLIFGLAVRMVIFFKGKVHERLAALFPEASEINAIKQMLVFYLSMVRQPTPRWYAHNPLWKMIYVFWYIALLLLVMSGGLMEDRPLIMGFYLPSVHGFWSAVVLWMTALHLLTLFLHDYYAKTTDVSAMINGYRLFEAEVQEKEDSGTPVVMQSMENLVNKEKS